MSVEAVKMYNRHDLYAVLDTSYMYQYYNDGSGNFSYEASYQLLSGGRHLAYYPVKLYENLIFAIADYDNDKVGFYWLQCMDSCIISSVEEFDVGNAPRRLAYADFNNDGKLDIVVANSGSDSISILWGEDYGTNRTDYLMGEAWDLAAGDFNQDGFADIAAANIIGIGLLLNNGDETFDWDTVFYFKGLGSSISTADFDNDGLLDLAVGYQDSGYVTIFQNPGDGNFSNPTHIKTNCASYALSAADFNNDGAIDLAASGHYYTWNDRNFSMIFNTLLDSDSDSIPDSEDNCPYTFNPFQEDSDYDGIGDSCDVDEPVYDVDIVPASDLYYMKTADMDIDNYQDLIYSGTTQDGLFIAYG
ncbi:MAG: hypothetical protein GWN00_15700, partial [Aliifodinibius sp.]|nr:VCBS repeat-containing protein [candidate division Zixibacteria bacterium]NIT57612.1 VCBS repeat-containing protein [Fodinibius sp.]NIW39822.1 hypothetical protein [candidate division Zixibacteria bacterium]NIX56493.1 hypothetical protein [candidate division Zixibacteria bacterium]NIY26194.1 hypothetical protein [Fodinibius sp.]